MRNWKTCFHRLLAVMFLTGWALTGQAQQIRTYFTMDEMVLEAIREALK